MAGAITWAAGELFLSSITPGGSQVAAEVAEDVELGILSDYWTLWSSEKARAVLLAAGLQIIWPGNPVSAGLVLGAGPAGWNQLVARFPVSGLPSWLQTTFGWLKETVGYVVNPVWDLSDWSQGTAGAIASRLFGDQVGEWVKGQPLKATVIDDILGPVFGPAVRYQQLQPGRGKSVADMFMEMFAGDRNEQTAALPPYPSVSPIITADYYARDLQGKAELTSLEQFRLTEIETPTLATLNRQVNLEQRSQEIYLQPMAAAAQAQAAQDQVRLQTIEQPALELQHRAIQVSKDIAQQGFNSRKDMVDSLLKEYRAAEYVHQSWWQQFVYWFRHIPEWLYNHIAVPIANMVASLWEIIRRGASYVVNELAPLVWSELSPALKGIMDRFQGIAHSGWNATMAALGAGRPISPEDAPGLALKMIGIATASGIAAHGIAQAIEWAHPLKFLGAHYVAGLLGELAGWGRWSAASVGVLAALAVGQPFRYYANDRFRPWIPRTDDLTMMAVKPDIPEDVFRRSMGYNGWSDAWIDAWSRTMYHEPRYFELSMMAEDGAAARAPEAASDLARLEFEKYHVAPEDQWLFMKARRAGYCPADSVIFTSSIKKKAARTTRVDYQRNLTNLYKEAFIDREEFDAFMEVLEVRQEVLALTRRSAALAAMYDYVNDCVRLYTDEYLKDVITEDDLSVALTGLGIQDYKVDLLVARARIRKTPKPRTPTVPAEEKELARIQKEYIKLYTYQYRKNLIDERQFLARLVTIGVTPELAAVTVEIEKTKKAPAEEVS